MEPCQAEELRKLKVNDDQLEVRFKRPQGDKHYAHTLPKRTQGESHPQCIVNTQDDPTKGDIQMEEKSRFRNEVRQAGKNPNK
ncbi:hypothetical protein JHK84_052819 [Glycine max]|nr:hypothetical protein JHK86_052791 [Glycine max]KAG4927160.1 hypothetical protein JHK85_053646 [Glycine max]KAG5082781.1 hypothetical protein JHK84_052819 [Glycine max]